MRFSRVPALSAGLAIAAILLPAQTSAPKGGTSSSAGSSTGTSGATSTGGLPGRATLPSNTSPTNSNTNPDGVTRGTFFYGKVVMPDGTAPSSQVVIERVCGTSIRPQAYADSKGNFSFQVGQTQEMISDASVSRASTIGTPTNTSNQSNSFSSANCDLRASLVGYRSDVINLAGRRSMDDPNVGTIFLHPLANVEGLTTSATSSLAPKEAQKAYEKGMDALKKSKIEDAQIDFARAAELYPRYASAWFELGKIYEQREWISGAREAYTKAIAADPKFVNPYERIYRIALKKASGANWQPSPIKSNI